MKIVACFVLVLSTFTVSAQEDVSIQEYCDNEANDSMSIQTVYDACISLRDAVANDDEVAIKQSAEDLRAVEISNFYFLHCKDDSIASLNGHLIFDEVFADSLAEGKDVFSKADEMNHTRALRGQTADGSILTKTCFVKAGKSTIYTFRSKGHQELAVVAEAGGLVTMKVHVTNSAGLDFRKDDTRSVHQGLPQRKTSFDLPTDCRNTVELEVINCGKKDCSFVVISN